MIEPSYFDTFVHIKQKSGRKQSYFAEFLARAYMCVYIIYNIYI